jgi:hypothetical protein
VSLELRTGGRRPTLTDIVAHLIYFDPQCSTASRCCGASRSDVILKLL